MESIMNNDERYSFTWGLTIKGMGHVQIFRFMLSSYAQLGITRPEMLTLIHLSSYHYNSPTGESRPSLTTIANEMGYSDRTNVSRLCNSLEKKGMLIITRLSSPLATFSSISIIGNK